MVITNVQSVVVRIATSLGQLYSVQFVAKRWTCLTLETWTSPKQVRFAFLPVDDSCYIPIKAVKRVFALLFLLPPLSFPFPFPFLSPPRRGPWNPGGGVEENDILQPLQRFLWSLHKNAFAAGARSDKSLQLVMRKTYSIAYLFFSVCVQHSTIR